MGQVDEGGLGRLAALMGIEAGYRSAGEAEVRTTDATRRALLAAMGVDAEEDAAIAAELDRRERDAASRLLGPVAVLRLGARALPLGPAAASAGPLRWTLRTEAGEVLAGEAEGAALPLPEGLPPGYHRLTVTDHAGHEFTSTLILAPQRCWLPEALERRPGLWGLAVQLPGLRTATDAGAGGFTELAQLVEQAADWGAAVVGLNPLHALFLDRPEQCSPYSPASRLFLNVLNIDPQAVPEFERCGAAQAIAASPGRQARLAAAKASRLVDWPAVQQLCLELLRPLHAAFSSLAEPERLAQFQAFRAEAGPALESFCRWQALRSHHAAGDPALADWRRWPPAHQDPASPEVKAFALQHAAEIDFLAWLQWLADEQLADVAALAEERGLPIGLYRDLAVGADAAGAETWAGQAVVATGASVGAPPDLFNPAGQNWGLPPFDPNRLRLHAYAGFVALVRANMRHAGGLRIDHVMALQRTYWVPAGRPAGEGAYVTYPLEELLGILALESQRHRCLVVGEDLGTVPEGFRERLHANGILGYRVVAFEWLKDGSFAPPEAYDPMALAMLGSHDLATLRGWWAGHDVHLKTTLGQYPSPDEGQRQAERRTLDKRRLLTALRSAGLALPAGFDAASPWDDALETAAHAFLARTRCRLAVAQLDDLAGNLDQVNLPGTVDQYANWRRKLDLTLEELGDDPRVLAIVGALQAARGGDAPI